MRCYRSLIFVCCIFSFFACKQKTRNGSGIEEGKAFTSAKTVVAKQPVPVNPDVCPTPQTIVVPQKAGQGKIELPSGKTLTLSPPETKLAGFSVHMQNYTTDQGLALDA